MERQEFTKELKDLMGCMTKEELEKTISVLNGCKEAVRKNDMERKHKVSPYFTDSDAFPAELDYTAFTGEKGVIELEGASLLTQRDFDAFKNVVPVCYHDWWLKDSALVINNGRTRTPYFDSSTAGKIRPVLVIRGGRGNLRPGSIFSVNGEEFKMIHPDLAIRIKPLEDFCTYLCKDYSSSIQRICVEGWFARLCRENH